MSEQNEDRVEGPLDVGDEARTEFGRQLAMDSILGKGCRGMGEDAASGVRAPTRWRRLSIAAVVFLGVGLGALLVAERFGGVVKQTLVGERDPSTPFTTDSIKSSEAKVVEVLEAQVAGEPIPAERAANFPSAGGVPSRRSPSSAPPVPGKTQTLLGAPSALDPSLLYSAPSLPTPDSTVVHHATASDSAKLGYVDLPRYVTDSLAVITPSTTGEKYDRIVENGFRRASEHQLSTFSIDVDTAAYANARDLLNHGSLPAPDAVRVEEMINYFDYDYPQPTGDHPLGIHVEMAQAPWAPRHRLVRIGLQAKRSHVDRPRANLVFLIDVSGSMSPPNKLPLLKRCMATLVTALRKNDRVALVVYAGAAGLVLDSTEIGDEEKVLTAITKLKSGGSTNGGAGIELAYRVAAENFVKGGINRVILASDGDFNVGVSDRASLIRMIEKKRTTGVFLSVLGFGRGNLRDSQMEQIANKGNGTYCYIDSLAEGHRVLVDKIGSTLVTVAKDVKIQVEFNPALVAGYRLIGYENRMLAKQDFNDDSKDAGEVGSGHAVTALYEVIPASVGFHQRPRVDPNRYSKKGVKKEPARIEPIEAASDELLFVKVRYKLPAGDKSTRLSLPVKDAEREFKSASADFRFAASVAAFGMILRRSAHRGLANYAAVLDMAEGALGDDAGGYRNGFLKLVEAARKLDPQRR
jgi:Ca-activated chloride channel homolog